MKNMKKSLALLLLPALMLVGCSKTLSSEDAEKVAAKIAEKQQELGTPKKVRVEAKETVDNESETEIYVVDVEAQRAYHKDKDSEQWLYKGSEETPTFYDVEHVFQAEGVEESKKYAKYTGSLAEAVTIEFGAWESYTGTYSQYPVSLSTEKYEIPGLTVKTKATSKGDGNLRYEVNVEGTAEGATGKVTVIVEWDNYFLTYYYSSEETEEHGKHESEIKISYGVDVSLPNLSDYTEVSYL